jgi:hypothetical protein
MGKRKKPTPDFYETDMLDPVRSATGKKASIEEKKSSSKEEKKKVGFYISTSLWDRFNRKFYELKLEGAISGNKSRLLEAALILALDDMDQGKDSTIWKMLV